MKKFILILLQLFIYSTTSAQGEAAVPFLVLQQSALFFGAGQIGAAIPTTTPTGFYLNPAQLGYFARNNNLAFSFMPGENRWMPNFGTDISFQSYGAAFGYNFQKNNENLPLSIGVGYIRNKMDFGKFWRITKQYPSGYSSRDYDAFDCFSIGVGYDYFLQFNLGFSIKSFESILGGLQTGQESRIAQASGTAFDFGFITTVPVTELFLNNIKYNLSDKSFVKPKLDITLGYSFTNIGDEIYYSGQEQMDPIPRTARLGYTLNLGIELFGLEDKLSAIDYSFTAEAEDILIKRGELSGYEYQGMLGDINIDKHLIELKKDNNVVVHRGHILKLFETVIIASGIYDGRGYNHLKTNGFGLSSEGIFKLLSEVIDNPVVKFISNHFVLEYYDSNIFVNSGFDTNIKGMSLFFKRMEF